MPVYRAAAALDRCLASVFVHTSLPPHRLILVVDGPQPEDVEKVLVQPLVDEGLSVRADEPWMYDV